MVRRSDGISTFNFTLTNVRRKYDGVFTPNDRVICVMKRLAWVRTFTGLLNSVPLITVWPRDVPLSASCSLKRLQYWYWDPHASATQEMIRVALKESVAAQTTTDGNITNVVHTILQKVVGWPSNKIHISRIPDVWFDIAQKIVNEVDKAAEESDRLRAEMQANTGASGSVAGDGTTTGALVNGRLSDDKYGGVSLKGDQCRNAETIYATGRSIAGITDRDCILGIACAMQESQLHNLSGGDADSVGLFQQRPSCGWGSVAQCTTPSYAAKKFFEHLLKVTNREQMRETQAIQAVQISAYPDRYQQWVKMASEVVRTLTSVNLTAASALGSDASLQAQKSALTKVPAPGTATGVDFAKAAYNLVTQYPNIKYSHEGPRTSEYCAIRPPKPMDCSLFVASVYQETTGKFDIPTQTDSQVSWLRANNARVVSPEEASKIPGALMYVGTIGATSHVEISLGDGKQVVGAHSTHSGVGVENYPYAKFDQAYLIPTLTYNTTGALDITGGTDDGTVNQLTDSMATMGAYGRDLTGYNENDPFDKIFGDNAWNPSTPESDPANLLSESLTGIRALMNDEPLLPYLKNLFNSTMRSHCSAPNGDLIAWFPDYYGLWGTAAKMVVEPIEVQDFTVEWADDFFVTHQYTLVGKGTPSLDVSTGDIADAMFAKGTDEAIRTETLGIANIDIPSMMYALFGIDATEDAAKNFATFIYKRFGARPSYQEMPGLVGPKAEFFSAVFMFMRQWAYQYNADVPLTFMPELWPGMLLQIPAFDFQAYVTTVTHTFRFGNGGGFSTTVNIAAPARLPGKKGDRDNVLIGLPLAGGYAPGRGLGNIAPVSHDVTELPNGKPILR